MLKYTMKKYCAEGSKFNQIVIANVAQTLFQGIGEYIESMLIGCASMLLCKDIDAHGDFDLLNLI